MNNTSLMEAVGAKRMLVISISEIKKNRATRLLQLLIIALIYISIRYVYPFFFPYYARQSFSILISPDRVIIGILTIGVVWFFQQKEYHLFYEKKKISGAIVFFLNYLYFIPGIFMNMLYDRDIEFAIIYSLYCLVFNLFCVYLGNKKIRKSKHHFNERDTNAVCIIAAALMLFISLWLSGFRINVLNIFMNSEVYQTRAENNITESHYILWYFIIFGASVIPTWLVIALRKKQYLVAALYTLTVFAMYSVSNNRQFIFTLAFAFLIYFFRNNKKLLLFIFLGLWGVPVIEWIIGKEYFFADIFRRFALVPNVDASFHVDYFMKNEPDWLRQALNLYANRIGLVSPYSEKIATLIGRVYFNTTVNANTGLVGGNFANYGYLSVVIGPALYAFSFRLLDKVFNSVKYSDINLATAVVVAFSCTNYENWIELLIVPSWILFYYISLLFMPIQGIEDNDEDGGTNCVTQ